MVWSAIIPAAASLVGGLFAQDKTDKRQEDAQAFNAAEAQRTRDFQERMSNSAYQRSMADMRAAGLNPILSYKTGGASSPTGATASTTYHAAQDVLTPAVNSAQAGRRLSAEIENMVQTNKNLQSQNELLEAQTMREGSQISNINADTMLKRAALSQVEKDAVRAGTDEEFYKSTAGKIIQMLGTGLKELNPMLPARPRIEIRPSDR